MIAEKDSVLERQISGRRGERIGSNNREFNKIENNNAPRKQKNGVCIFGLKTGE